MHDTEGSEARLEDRVGRLEAEVADLKASADQASLVQMLLSDNARRRAAEEKLATAQEWIQLAQEVGCAAAYTFDFGKNELSWSASTYALYGWPATRTASVDNWLAAIHPEDRPAVQEVADAALSHGKPVQHEFRIVRADGEIRWIQDRGRVLVNEQGQATRLVGLNIDITDLKVAEQRLNFIVGEVGHRFKNLLTVVQAMIEQTARDPEDDAKTLREKLVGRIAALARSKELLLQHQLEEVPLLELVEAQLFSVTGRRPDVIIVDGPPVDLLPSSAQPLGMVLHELATNACKHGALKERPGQLKVLWQTAGETFELRWKEAWEGREAETSPNAGFGSRVTKQMIERAVGGRTQASLSPNGFSWVLEAPVGKVLVAR